MLNGFSELLIANTTIAMLVRTLIILFFTWVTANVGSWLVVRALKARMAWDHVQPRRFMTLQALIGSAFKVVVYLMGFVVLLRGLGIPGGSILTAAALFSAGFGFAARPLISDYLAGMILIFEDQFAVGDKVELLAIIGVVEAVDLRTTHIRSTTGELYIVPNGDVRVVRNLSRGLFSIATIKVTVATDDLSKALQVLEEVSDNAQAQVNSLIERPEFLSEEGTISNHVELTLSAKAQYALGVRARTRLMALVTDAFNQAGVRIIN